MSGGGRCGLQAADFNKQRVNPTGQLSHHLLPDRGSPQSESASLAPASHKALLPLSGSQSHPCTTLGALEQGRPTPEAQWGQRAGGGAAICQAVVQKQSQGDICTTSPFRVKGPELIAVSGVPGATVETCSMLGQREIILCSWGSENCWRLRKQALPQSPGSRDPMKVTQAPRPVYPINLHVISPTLPPSIQPLDLEQVPHYPGLEHLPTSGYQT